MSTVLSGVVSLLLSAISHLPRAALAKIGREVLSELATKVEGQTTNQIVHEGETLAFTELDALLAKIEASGK